MDRAEHIEFGRQLLERLDLDRRAPKIGHLLAADWASGAFAHALMAYSGMEYMNPGEPTEMYDAAARVDREDGGGERCQQAACAAYELSRHFCYGLSALTSGELERETGEAGKLAAELLDRLDPSGEQAGSASL